MVRYMQHLWLKLALNNYKAVNQHDKNAFADSITISKAQSNVGPEENTLLIMLQVMWQINVINAQVQTTICWSVGA